MVDWNPSHWCGSLRRRRPNRSSDSCRAGAASQDNELVDNNIIQDGSKKLPIQTVRPVTDNMTLDAPNAPILFHEQRTQSGVHTQNPQSLSSEDISGCTHSATTPYPSIDGTTTDANTSALERSGQPSADTFQRCELDKVSEPTSEERQAGRNETIRDTLQEPSREYCEAAHEPLIHFTQERPPSLGAVGDLDFARTPASREVNARTTPGSADGRMARAGRVTFGLSLGDSTQDMPQAQRDAETNSQAPDTSIETNHTNAGPQRGTNTDAPGTPINTSQLALELGAQQVARERAARRTAQEHQDILDGYWTFGGRVKTIYKSVKSVFRSD